MRNNISILPKLIQYLGYTKEAAKEVLRKFRTEKTTLENIRKHNKEAATDMFKKLAAGRETISRDEVKNAILSFDALIQVEDVEKAIATMSDPVDEVQLCHVLCQWKQLSSMVTVNAPQQVTKEENISTRIFLRYEM